MSGSEAGGGADMADTTDTPDTGERATQLVLVTGMSGAGRSTALNILEDAGYEAVDNLPLSLLENVVAGGNAPARLAIGIDIRTRDFDAEQFIGQIGALAAQARLMVSVVFLDCDSDVLMRRFTETRRRHPLAIDRPVADGISLERKRLAPLRELADIVIDTSQSAPADLRSRLMAAFGGTAPTLAVFVQSFSYKRGLPRESDLVFDVRFLRNPHYDAELRPMTGLDAPVADYVAADPGFADFFERLTGLIAELLPRYASEGKSYLTISVGCTGGRHRSVYVTRRLADWLSERDWMVTALHRDLGAADADAART